MKRLQVNVNDKYFLAPLIIFSICAWILCKPAWDDMGLQLGAALLLGVSLLISFFTFITIIIRTILHPTRLINHALLTLYTIVALLVFIYPSGDPLGTIMLRSNFYLNYFGRMNTVHEVETGVEITGENIRVIQKDPPIVYFQAHWGWFTCGGFIYSQRPPDSVEALPWSYFYEQINFGSNWWWIEVDYD